MRITVDGHRAEFSTGKNVELSKWNTSQNRVKGNSEEARITNRHFDVLQSKVFEIKNKLAFSSEYFDATDIKNLLTGSKVTERYLCLFLKNIIQGWKNFWERNMHRQH